VRSRLARLALLGLAALAGACSGAKVTELVVAVGTNLAVPAELDALQLEIARASKPTVVRLLPLVASPGSADSITLPCTIGIFPGADPSELLTITAAGLKGSARVVERSAKLTFVPDRIILLRLDLLRSCVGVTCAPGLTCDGGTCVSPEIKEPWLLPDYDEAVALRRLEGGAGDGRADARTDAPSDLGPPDVKPWEHAPDRGADHALPDAKRDAPKLLDKGPDKGKVDAPVKLDKAPLPDQKKGDTKAWPDTKPTPDLGPPCDTPPAKSCSADTLYPSISWCKVPAGCYTAGEPSTLCGAITTSKVHITKAFEISTTEVTEQQFKDVMGYPATLSSCGGGAGSCPMVNVTWHEAMAYCRTLSVKRSLPACYVCSGSGASVVCDPTQIFGPDYLICSGYRLPTDAEWEYAARAGTTAMTYGGDLTNCDTDAVATGIAIYKGYGSQRWKVAQRSANALGLYDMSGNVFEWVFDGWANSTSAEKWDPVEPGDPQKPEYRDVRGGAYYSPSKDLRSGYRGAACGRVGGTCSQSNYSYVGFRCARTRP